MYKAQTLKPVKEMFSQKGENRPIIRHVPSLLTSDHQLCIDDQPRVDKSILWGPIDLDLDLVRSPPCFQDLEGSTYLVAVSLKEHLATMRTYHGGPARACQERRCQIHLQ